MSSSPPPSSPSVFSNNSNHYQGESQKASVIPLIIAGVAIFVSLILILVYQDKSAGIGIYILGYFLTPFIVVIMMGWDTINQRKQISSDPWFIPRPIYSRILRILTAVSFLVALPHIWNLSKILADYLPAPLVELLMKFGN